MDQVIASTPLARSARPTCAGTCIHSNAAMLPKPLRRRELRVLRQDADRREGAAAALEALRRRHRQRPRRGARQDLRRAHVRRRRQGAHARDGRGDRGGDGPRHRARSPGCPTETKKAARAKLRAVANKIGYPDKWRDYSTLQIVRGDAYGNSQRANAFELPPPAGQDRQAGRQDRVADDAADGQRLLQPAREQHQLPGRHPAAAVLQQGGGRRGELRRGRRGRRPRADARLRRPGRQFDAEGNLRDWWTPADGKEFEERAPCVVNQYGGYTAVDDVKVNGKLTLGREHGRQRRPAAGVDGAEGDARKTRPLGAADGFTPEQRFFVGWGADVVPEPDRRERGMRATDRTRTRPGGTG